jgi:hypothetical protein
LLEIVLKPDPNSKEKIQPLPSGDAPSMPSAALTDLPGHDALARRKKGLGHVASGMVFGALVSLLMGPLVGEACCWLGGRDDLLWKGILIGVGIGPFGGAIIGLIERKRRGDLVRPDVATMIGVFFGWLPGLLSMPLGFTCGLLEIMVIGPILGFLIGAILDRGYEAQGKNSWGAALGFVVTGMAACVGIGLFMIAMPLGPDPAELARKAKSHILEQWRKDPQMHDATIQTVTLVRHTGQHYSGSFEATIGGRPARFALKVKVLDGGLATLEWEPADE